MRKAGQSREARQRLLHSAVTVFPTFDQSFLLFFIIVIVIVIHCISISAVTVFPTYDQSFLLFFFLVKNMIQSVLLLLGTMPIHAVFLYNPGPGIKRTAEYNMIQIIIPSLHTMQCIIII